MQNHPALTVQGIFVGDAASKPFALCLFVLTFSFASRPLGRKKG
jgi:hypothetical protein